MNELLLSLVASPGGNDAIAGLMAKAPPGESPPATAASFLQILLQSIPGMQAGSALALLGMEPVQPQGTTQADTDVVQPAANEGSPDQPDVPVVNLSALEALLMTLTVPAGDQPEQQGTPESLQVSGPATGSPRSNPPIVPLQAAPADLVRTTIPAQVLPLVEPAPAAETQPVVEQDRAIEVRPPGVLPDALPEMRAEIPAPETREGSAKAEGPRIPMPHIQRVLPMEKSDAPEQPVASPKLTPTMPRVSVPRADAPAPSGKGPRVAAQRVGMQDPRVLPGAEPAVELPAVTELSAEETPAVPVKAQTKDVKAERTFQLPEISGRTFTLDREVPEQKQGVEPAPARAVGSRHAEREREHEAGSRQQRPEKSVERAILVEPPDAPAMTEKTARPVTVPQADEAKPVTGETRPAETPLEAAKAHGQGSASAGATREQAEPLAARHVVGTVQGHPSREAAGTQLMKDVTAMTSKLQLRLTEELSRSVMDQVVKHVVLQVHGETSEMRIRLDPPSLGEMQVTVRVDEGRVRAQIDVTQPAVRVALETNVPQLRQSLADQGIDVHRIDVCASGSSMSQESREGDGHRSRKRENGRQQASLDGVDQYRGARMMGYNTIEMVM